MVIELGTKEEIRITVGDQDCLVGLLKISNKLLKGTLMQISKSRHMF